jgi:hypothetical protein
MNLIESATVEATRSIAAVSFGAFVPVGEIGSGALHVNCLVRPVRVFPLGSFAFFCLRARRVASSLNLQSAKIARPGENGFFCLRFQRGRKPCLNLKHLWQSWFMGRLRPRHIWSKIVCLSLARSTCDDANKSAASPCSSDNSASVKCSTPESCSWMRPQSAWLSRERP